MKNFSKIFVNNKKNQGNDGQRMLYLVRAGLAQWQSNRLVSEIATLFGNIEMNTPQIRGNL